MAMAFEERDKILEKTSGGLEVFAHYIGEQCGKRLFCNPYRTDSNPSCTLKLKNNRYYFMDYGDSSWHGDCFWFVATIKHINLDTDFMEVLRVIDKDLDLFILNEAPQGWHPEMRKVPKIAKPKARPIGFEAKYKVFSSSEISYWLSYGITKDILDRFNVRSMSECRFICEDGSDYKYYGSYQYPMYAYLFKDGKAIKAYRPGSKTRFLYAGELPKPYIFGWDQLPKDGKYVFITGGEKDAMSYVSHGFPAISLNSETSRIQEDTLEILSDRFERIIFSYDNDETGRRESETRVSEHKGKYPVCRIVLPLKGTKTEKDISDFFRLGHSADEIVTLLNNQIVRI